MRVAVKICGIRSLEEALLASEHGADMLGFNFWPGSPRHISPEGAGAIISHLPAGVSAVGVFVNEDADRVLEIAQSIKLDWVQLHGNESTEYCATFAALKILKAFRVSDEFNPASIADYSVNMVLLDSAVNGRYGGTGKSFDWTKAIEAKRYAPIMLAGGLDATNVVDAISKVKPAAVDVCSGVEAEPGRKDPEKLKRFLAVMRKAQAGE